MAQRIRARRAPRLDITAYRGKWVAIDPETDKIVANDISLRAVEQKAVKRGVEKPILMAVPETDAYFVG